MEQLEAAKNARARDSRGGSYTCTGASRTAVHGPAYRQRESHARMGVPRRTSPAGTIQRRAFAGWNASTHHTSSAAPPRPIATRLAVPCRLRGPPHQQRGTAEADCHEARGRGCQ
uniref:Uncharacterized protein n=1 Tax=Oryza rufipogon TaxID=4529 RepID=A0A0E0NU84_ORYRU